MAEEEEYDEEEAKRPDEPTRRRKPVTYDLGPADLHTFAAEPTPSPYSVAARAAPVEEVDRATLVVIARKVLLEHYRRRRATLERLDPLEDSTRILLEDSTPILVSGDVEHAIFDPDFAARMKAVRLARARRAPDWAERWQVLEDEYERRRALARAMLGDWVIDIDLHDGHVAEVELGARELVEHGEELLLRAPWVRHLHLNEYRSVGPSLFDCSSLRGMQSLGLPSQELSDHDIEALVASPHVDGLRWLDLSENALSQRAFEALATCPALARLEYLGLEYNESESPVDRAGTDAMDGSVVSTTHTKAGRALERLAGHPLLWLHAPARFPTTYPPSPLDVATSG